MFDLVLNTPLKATMDTVVTIKLLWKQLTLIFRAISEIRGKSKRSDEVRIYNFVRLS